MTAQSDETPTRENVRDRSLLLVVTFDKDQRLIHRHCRLSASILETAWGDGVVVIRDCFNEHWRDGSEEERSAGRSATSRL